MCWVCFGVLGCILVCVGRVTRVSGCIFVCWECFGVSGCILMCSVCFGVCVDVFWCVGCVLVCRACNIVSWILDCDFPTNKFGKFLPNFQFAQFVEFTLRKLADPFAFAKKMD